MAAIIQLLAKLQASISMFREKTMKKDEPNFAVSELMVLAGAVVMVVAAYILTNGFGTNEPRADRPYSLERSDINLVGLDTVR